MYTLSWVSFYDSINTLLFLREPHLSIAISPFCDVYVEMFISDPNCLHPGSASKNLSVLTKKIVSKV